MRPPPPPSTGTLAIEANDTVNLFGTIALTGLHVSYLITFADFLNCLIFLLAFIVLKLRMSSMVESANRKLVSAADFTVLVQRLPSGECACVRVHPCACLFVCTPVCPYACLRLSALECVYSRVRYVLSCA